MKWTLASILGTVALTGCTFNFDVTTQRTALENQVMGSYRELEDDLILASSVRGDQAAKTAVSTSKKRALDARQNQEFNRDDIDELKDKGLLGETVSGSVALLPKGIGAGEHAAKKDADLARALVEEENRDRAEIWQRIIDANENLSEKDLPEVRKTYAKLQRETTRSGQWFQNESGQWTQKPGAESLR